VAVAPNANAPLQRRAKKSNENIDYGFTTSTAAQESLTKNIGSGSHAAQNRRNKNINNGFT